MNTQRPMLTLSDAPQDVEHPQGSNPPRIPEWMRRRQQKQNEARARFGTDRVADRVLAQ